MLVSEIMTTDVAFCGPKSDLGVAITTMLEHDCGFIPVVDTRSKVIGVLTDRDACLALAFHRRTPSHVLVEEVMTHPVFTCKPDDAVLTALGTMSLRRVRRLPVVDGTGVLQGVVTMNDVIVAPRRPGGPTSEDIVETLDTICRHPSLATVTE